MRDDVAIDVSNLVTLDVGGNMLTVIDGIVVAAAVVVLECAVEAVYPAEELAGGWSGAIIDGASGIGAEVNDCGFVPVMTASKFALLSLLKKSFLSRSAPLIC